MLRTLEAFQNTPQISEAVIAVPAGTQSQVKRWVGENGWKKPLKVIPGGKTRAESVWKALQKSDPKSSWVVVHDGARPFVSSESMKKVFLEMKSCDAVVLGKKVVPTIKEIDKSGRVSRTVDRNYLCEAETPQVIKRDLLVRAYREVPKAMEATDEAALLEASGVPVHLVTHDEWNPKITTAKDFELAEAFLNQHAEVRTGFGRDTHRLVPKRIFWLGGIRIPFNKGPLGHSDGDVLLHAVIDAILGAAGKGDIGDWFSDQDPKFKNIPSSKMLAAVFREIQSEGFRIEHIDSTIILERPKLGVYKKKMKLNLAKLLQLKPDQVSVKAKTAEGLGPEGEGLAITCEAAATLKRNSHG